MVRRQAICFLFLSALICVFLNPAISAYAAVEPGEFTDGLLREYRTAFSNLEDRMIQAARGIFAALFLCHLSDISKPRISVEFLELFGCPI